MEQIVVKHRDGTRLLLNSQANISGITRAEQKVGLLSDDLTDITVVSATPLNFELGDTIDVFGKTYTLNFLPTIKKTGKRKFSYDLTFEGPQYELLDVQFLLPDDTTGDSFTGNLKDFLEVLLQNIRRIFPRKWALGEYPADTESKTLSYVGENCLFVLQNLCKEHDMEFEIGQENGVKTLHIRKAGVNFPYTFRYGRTGGLYELTRKNINSKNVVTRLYVYGGSNNLGSKYRYGKLCLPGKIKNKSYIESEAAIAAFGVKENIKTFDEIFPKRYGKVTGLGVDYRSFVDNTMNFDLNEKESDNVTTRWLINGVKPKVKFTTGNLAGYEFECSYDHATKTITVDVFTDKSGLRFPSKTSPAFQIQAGDVYFFTDINLPDSYKTDAEIQLSAKGMEYYNQNSQPQAEYGLSIDQNFVKQFAGELTVLNLFAVGDYIPVEDTDIGVNKSIRITGFTRDLLKPYKYSLTLGDSVTQSSYTRIISDLKEIDKVIEINDLADPAKARRNWKASQEVLAMVFDPEGDYYTDKIKPGSIDTLMLSVGAKSMQFTLQNTLIEANYQGNKNSVKVTGGMLAHHTISDKVINWNLATATVTLSGDSAAYYIYAKCQKAGNAGNIIFSTIQITVDQDPNYYHFWVGVVNSVVDEVRAVSLTYGATTINGKFIRTGQIESSDGSCFINLDGNGFRLGDNASSLAWNNNKDRKLRLKGALVQSPSGDENALGVFRGSYSSYSLYYKGDEVTYNGSMYRCIKDCPAAGIMPINTTYWQLVAKKGTDGGKGNDGAGGAPGEMAPTGKMLYRNPDFSQGLNGILLLNNLVNGNTTIERVPRTSDCPNNSTHCIKITNKGVAEPGLGGFSFQTMSRSNAKFITRIIAKIPVGYSIEISSNYIAVDGGVPKYLIGEGGFHKWLTPKAGTGKYEEYICVVQCGASGSFSKTNFFYLIGDSGSAVDPVVWYLSYATVFDATQAEVDYAKEIDNSIDVQPIYTYRGDYSSSVGYTGSNQRVDLVKYNNIYYRARRKLNGSFSNQTPADNSAYWENFGARFESVATNLLLAENATIGDWVIKNGRITSQRVTKDGTPRAILNGADGGISLASDVHKYTPSGERTEKPIKQIISLDSESGNIEVRTSENDVSYINSQGIFSNRAGTQAVSAAVGIELKAAIVALGFGNLEKSAYASLGSLCGLYADAHNSNGNPSPTWGAFINKLLARGMYYGSRRISGSTWLNENDTYISCYNTVTISVYLPGNPQDGMILFIRRMSGATVTAYGNGKSVHVDGGAPRSSLNIGGGPGDTAVFIYDGQYWNYNYMIR